MTNSNEFLNLFQRFIRHMEKGKRLKKDGSKIKTSSIQNYKFTFKLLQDFCSDKNESIVINSKPKKIKFCNKKSLKYWNQFYLNFTNYLYNEKQCFDNYVGQNVKNLHTFFNWLNDTQGINIGTAQKYFYIRNEQIPIITLSQEQLRFLVNDREFNNKLSYSLRKTKSMFIIGCLTGLRFSDLMDIKKSDILERDGNSYLQIILKKLILIYQTNYLKLP